MTDKSRHYVDNKKLYTEMVKYIAKYNEAKEKGEQTPPVTNYIGECVYLIANKLATARNFSGYTYKDDMICDAIENCLRYLHNFDPDKTKNPFAYFTRIMYFAFLRRIESEKKQAYIKYKVIENSGIMNTLIELSPGDTQQFNAMLPEQDIEKLAALADRFETKQKNKEKEI